MKTAGLALACLLALPACEPADLYDGETLKPEEGKADTSAEAVFLDFEWDGVVYTNSTWNPNQQVEDQLLYTVGQLNGDKSIGRLDKVVLTGVVKTQEDGKTKITYHARMPVAWGKRNSIPGEYTFKLPKDISYAGQNAFTDKYKDSCVDWSAHDVTSGIMWYYYRPARSGCRIDDADIVTLTASVGPSPIQTTGKYPEYHKVWEDNIFKVVAIFGKYEDGATGSSDAGISTYNRFTRLLKGYLQPYGLVTTPAEVPYSPGVEMPDITFNATMPDGRAVEVVAILVDNVRTAGPTFNARYEALSSRADLIAYNGHSGLGANIRALAQKGRWLPGQYTVVFMNGCDTYAYVDSALNDAHAAVNPDDPNGTKYVDIVTNAMPSYFASMAEATMAIVRALNAVDNPKTYETMFRDVDRAQVILVSGEEDNVFVPGGGGDEPGDDAWAGLAESGTVARGEEHRFTTPRLAAGRYVFDITGTRDADLYVRVGSAPTLQDWDCRPYKSGSNESCAVELPTAGTIHVMVRGYASSSTYELEGRKE